MSSSIRDSLLPKPRKTLSTIPAPAKLTQPKSPNFAKPRARLSVFGSKPVEKQLKPSSVAKPPLVSSRKSIYLGNGNSRFVKPLLPAPAASHPVTNNNNYCKPSFGFLRPTQSSMAKQHSGTSLPGLDKLDSVEEAVEAVSLNEIHPTKQPESGLENHKENSHHIRTETSQKLSPSAPPHFDVSAASTLSISFHTNEGVAGEDKDFQARCLFHDSSPIKSASRRQTIIPTPKYPRTRSVEKQTKRKLSFIPLLSRYHGAQERLRCAYSPPPDFDVTINSASMSPLYVPKPPNYDGFSTPIMNLTAALSITDDEDESVYYTPCAEI